MEQFRSRMNEGPMENLSIDETIANLMDSSEFEINSQNRRKGRLIELYDIQEEIEKRFTRLNAYAKKLADTKQQLDKERNDYGIELLNKINQIESQENAAEIKIKQLKRELDDTESHISEMELQKISTEQKIRKLEENCTTSEARLITVTPIDEDKLNQDNITPIIEEIKSIQTLIKETKQHSKQISDVIQSHAKDIAFTRKEAQKEINHAEKYSRVIANEKTRFKELSSNENLKSESFSSKRNQILEHKDQMRNDIDNINSNMGIIIAKINKLNEDEQKIKLDIEKKQKINDDLNSKLEKRKNDLSLMQNKLKSARSEMNKRKRHKNENLLRIIDLSSQLEITRSTQKVVNGEMKKMLKHRMNIQQKLEEAENNYKIYEMDEDELKDHLNYVETQMMIAESDKNSIMAELQRLRQQKRYEMKDLSLKFIKASRVCDEIVIKEKIELEILSKLVESKRDLVKIKRLKINILKNKLNDLTSKQNIVDDPSIHKT